MKPRTPRSKPVQKSNDVEDVDKQRGIQRPGKRVPAHGGGMLNTGGTPGNKGGGRPPDAWKAACRELASRQDMLDRAREVLADPTHDAWLGAWKFLAEQGYGKAPQRIEVAGDAANPLEIVIRREA